MRKLIHVHQQRIKQGLAPIIVRTYRGVTYAKSVEILGPSTIKWADKPLDCGARVWIETHAEVKIEEADEKPSPVGRRQGTVRKAHR